MNFRVLKLILFAVVICFVVGITVVQVVANSQAWFKAAMVHVIRPKSYNFEIYDKLLHQFVVGDLVDYKGLCKSPLLNQAVDDIAKINPSNLDGKEAKLCYWLNVYNLLMLKTVCDRYPVGSVIKLGNSPSLVKYTVGGDIYSAVDVFDSKLEPLIAPRPLSAFLVCGAAQGYPALVNHAILPSGIKHDEEANLKSFVNDPRNTLYDEVSNRFLIASYFQHYSDEISAYFVSPHDLANYYLDKRVDITNATMIKAYLRTFNWALNDTALGKIDPEKKLK